MLLFPVFLGVITDLAVGVSALSGQTRDAVVLRSGQPITGEIKNLRRGDLSYDTPEMDIVSVDWDDIAFVTSPAFFEVETAARERYFGSLASPDTAVLVVVGTQRSDTLTFQEVVEIGPIEAGFFARTNGFVDFGTNLTPANSLASILLKGRFAYRSTTSITASPLRTDTTATPPPRVPSNTTTSTA